MFLVVPASLFFLSFCLRNRASFLTGYFDSEFRVVAPVDLELVRPVHSPSRTASSACRAWRSSSASRPRRLVSRAGPFLARPPPIEDVAGNNKKKRKETGPLPSFFSPFFLFSTTFVAPWHIGAPVVADVATFAPLSSAEGLVNAREYAYAQTRRDRLHREQTTSLRKPGRAP